METAIEAEGLTKRFRRLLSGREVLAVDDVSLAVRPGVAYGLLGPNGAGKTTIVKMLLSAIRPTAGTARLFGVDCRRPRARAGIGYLPENHRFPTYNTGRQMLDFYAALSGMPAVERRSRAGELLELVGLADRADDRIGKYSKGMLQRLGLAQALMHRPTVLFLDEPGDGVDPVGRRLIRNILRQQQAEGVTIFLNSHLLAEVEMFCDETAIIRQGRLALSGRIAELTAGSGYHVAAVEPPEAVRIALAARAGDTAAHNGFVEFRFDSRGAANSAIDLLRREKVEVESVERRRSTLEDVFLNAVEGAAGSAREAAQ